MTDRSVETRTIVFDFEVSSIERYQATVLDGLADLKIGLLGHASDFMLLISHHARHASDF